MSDNSTPIETEAPEIWQRLPAETDLAWHAFVAYRDMGGRRSLRKSSKTFYELEETATDEEKANKLQQFARWSSKYNWVVRARAYDHWLEEETRWEQVEAVREMKRRHATVANMALAKAAEKLRIAASHDMSVADAARLLDLSVRIERQARGEPDQMVSGPNGEPIKLAVDDVSIDALEARLRALITENERVAEDEQQPEVD